ncbi:MAG TPA: PAAR-like domain-containing protein [Archangium sp.]|nr:PAAR-like domain-containing protein [Archangium sp.]
MATTVMVNGRTVVHKKSDGVSTSSPDPCLTPTPSPSPVPYANVAKSSDTAAGASSVLVDGVPLAIKSSYFALSTGDEPGTAGGGVVSGRIKGKASFVSYSFDVMVEGENVPRLGDSMQHNHGSPGNAISPSEVQPPNASGAGLSPADKQALCQLMCHCNKAGNYKTGADGRALKQLCVSTALQGIDDTLSNKSFYKPEISYDMRPPRPSPIMDSKNPLRGHGWVPGWMEKNGVPAGSGQVRRPDVIIVKDRTRPPTQDNIKQVVEMKFPGDTLTLEQQRAYENIAGDPGKFAVLKLEDCNCPQDKQPQEQPEPVSEPSWWEIPLLCLALIALLADDLIPSGITQGDDVLIPGIIARLAMAF